MARFTKKSAARTAQGIGIGLEAGGQILSGRQGMADARFTADQLRRQANSAEATGQRAASSVRRQQRLLQSRAQAVAAASGGSASDVSVLRSLAEIEREGEYAALTALWEGSDQAAGLREQASATIASAKAHRRGKFIGAAASLTKLVGG